MNGTEFVEFMAATLYANPGATRHYARVLRAAGMAPAEDEMATTEHAVNMLLAICGAGVAAEAATAAATLGALPQKDYREIYVLPQVILADTETPVASAAGPVIPIESCGWEEGQGPALTARTSSLRSFLRAEIDELAAMISKGEVGAFADDAHKLLALWVRIGRDLSRPSVMINVWREPSILECGFRRDDPALYAAPIPETVTDLPRYTLHAIAAAFAPQLQPV